MLEAVSRYPMKYVRYDWQTNSMAHRHMPRHVRLRVAASAHSPVKLRARDLTKSDRTLYNTSVWQRLHPSRFLN